ncbi:MAG: exodeoxyribonuclease V subunit gamma, partial [Gammaproteobacteria bacterium]
MFILHSSNKTENLVMHLCAVFENSPLSSPFSKEVFLIQSQGMERWLSQQLTSRFGVFGNFEFLFPGRFFSLLSEKIELSLSDAVFDRELMIWRIENLLRGLEGDEFLPLAHYLSGENAAMKRYQLARQLAHLFDQYQIMRPQMLEAWQKGMSFYDSETEVWQGGLWREIIEICGDRHRGMLWLEAIARLNEAGEGGLAGLLPERVSVFGLNTMPPLFLSYLAGLSKHCQLHLYLLNPAQTYWADLSGRRQRLKKDADGGHPLLAALGQQGCEFQEMLLEQAQFDFEPESFEPSPAENNLQRLQNDILNNALSEHRLSKDASIGIHACHSRMREAEVLKDQLLLALEQDASLELRDIVVMAPDIEVYEPFISAVFHDIQHAVADRSLRLNNPVIDAFEGFLELSQSRFGWQSVLDLLERPLVSAGFGLTESDLELIRHWLSETRVRWGKSAEHKRELGLPELSENTWQAALERLLMGYAVNSDAEFVDGVLPYADVEGSSAQALGGLCDFVDLLFEAASEFSQPKPLAAWSDRLFYYAGQLFKGAEAADLNDFYEILAVLSDDIAPVHGGDLELPVIADWLKGAIDERNSSTGFLRGQLTFCSMLPMRAIPFRIIALMGMNEGEFPKIDRHPTFDLLAGHFQKGDRSRRADDRYQFLEIMLSAREKLIITYIGQSISSNERLHPSVVVSELLDILELNYRLDGLVTQHPLQPFSPRYFNGTDGLFSFSDAGFQTAKALSEREEAPDVSSSAWWQGTIAEPGTARTDSHEIIELSELFAFYQHPQRYFMRRQLELRFNGIEAAAEERESFELDRLEEYGIDQEWIHDTLNGNELTLKKLQAQGRWLSGVIGDLEFARRQQDLHDFVER